MAYRAPLLLDDNMIVSRHRGIRVQPTAFALNSLRRNCSLVEGGKDLGDLKILGRIRALMGALGVYGGG